MKKEMVYVNKSKSTYSKNSCGKQDYFLHHDASVNDASIVKSFPDEESTDLYWNALLKSCRDIVGFRAFLQYPFIGRDRNFSHF